MFNVVKLKPSLERLNLEIVSASKSTNLFYDPLSYKFVLSETKPEGKTWIKLLDSSTVTLIKESPLTDGLRGHFLTNILADEIARLVKAYKNYEVQFN